MYLSIIDFLLNRVLILNCSSLLGIRFNQENYFNENIYTHSEFDLRLAGADLLKSCYFYINPHKIGNILSDNLNKCQISKIDPSNFSYYDVLKVPLKNQELKFKFRGKPFISLSLLYIEK